MRSKRCAINGPTSTVAAGGLELDARGISHYPTDPAPLADWTILVFLNGDNNLEPDLLRNFQQMAQIGSTRSVNIVVQFDRIGKYASTDPQWTQTLRFRVTKGMEPLPAAALEDIGEANMGDGAVLGSFVEWGQTAFPAKRYMLIISDHGQGWRIAAAALLRRYEILSSTSAFGIRNSVASFMAASTLLRTGSGVAAPGGKTGPFRGAPGDAYRSVSWDETSDDILYNREIEDGLKAVLAGSKIDVIGFDACLMGMIETAYALRDVGAILVASEELVPGPGWDYEDFCRRVVANPKMSAKELAVETIASYEGTYGKTDGTTTLAAIDLGQVPGVVSTLSRFSDRLRTRLDTEVQWINEARASTLQYAPGYRFMHVDLVRVLKEYAARTTSTDLRVEAQGTAKAVADAVVKAYAGSDRQGAYGSNGLAIYFPATGAQYASDPFNEGGYERNNQHFPVEFVQDCHWGDFLHALWVKVPAP